MKPISGTPGNSRRSPTFHWVKKHPFENTVDAPAELAAPSMLFDEVEALILDGEPGAALRRLGPARTEPFPTAMHSMPDHLPKDSGAPR